MNINKIIEDTNKVKSIQCEINKITKQAELDLNLKEAKKTNWNNISEFRELFENEVFTEYTVIAEWQYEIDDYLEKLNYRDWCQFQFSGGYTIDNFYVLDFKEYIQVYQEVYSDRDLTYICTRLYTINKSEFDVLNLI